MAMGQMISPGVYTRIIDLSEYLADVPGTVAFMPFLSKKGPDNKLVFVASQEQYAKSYGEPNINDYGKAFGQGPYVLWNHLSVSSHLYALRCLPDDATYAHLVFGMQMVEDEINYSFSSSSGTISESRLKLVPMYFDGASHPNASDPNADPVEYPSINHIAELATLFTEPNISDYVYAEDGIGIPYGWLMYFRAVGRGDWYNRISIRLTRNPNPAYFGRYRLDIFETKDDGDLVISESFVVSFDPTALDDQGDSLFISEVVNKFSELLRCEVNPDALRELEIYKMQFYKNDPTLPDWVTEFTVLDQNGQATDLGYKATKIEFARLDFNYTEDILNTSLQNLATARAMPTNTTNAIIARNQAVAAAIAEVSQARSDYNAAKRYLEDAYQLDLMDIGDANPETASIDPIPLGAGSEGSLVYADRNTGQSRVDVNTAKQVLAQGYTGLLNKPDNGPNSMGIWDTDLYCDEMLDLDWIYFSLVYEAYPADVKDAALELCHVYRKDCMLISDVGDNIKYSDVETFVGGNPSIPSGRLWNSRYAARYEPYSKVYDKFTGSDLWLSPVYHMAQIIPMTDSMYELWYAPAGFNRATINSIKELRWSPKLGERDNLYMLQVNPIVHFPQGYTVWSQLTTQKRASALQDINCMRLVLYIKRALEQFCKYYIFEFNDKITHEAIKNGIVPFLSRIKARRGLVDFNVEVGADEYEFKNKICHVNVTLQPMKVIEKIELNLYVK